MTTKPAKPATPPPARRPWAERSQPTTGGEYVPDGDGFTPTKAEQARRKASEPEPKE